MSSSSTKSSSPAVPSQQSVKKYVDDAAGGSGLVEIVAPTNLPSANVVDITDIPQTYSAILLVLNGASTDTASRAVEVLVSVDNGSNFLATGVSGHVIRGSTVTAMVGASALVGSPNTQAAAEIATYNTMITGYASAAYKTIVGAGRYAGSTGYSLNAVLEDTGGIDALRIRVSSTGNFDGGTYSLYGLR